MLNNNNKLGPRRIDIVAIRHCGLRCCDAVTLTAAKFLTGSHPSTSHRDNNIIDKCTCNSFIFFMYPSLCLSWQSLLFNDIYFTVPPFTASSVMDPMSLVMAGSVHADKLLLAFIAFDFLYHFWSLTLLPTHRNRLHKIHRSVVCKMSSFMFKWNATFRFYLTSKETKRWKKKHHWRRDHKNLWCIKLKHLRLCPTLVEKKISTNYAAQFLWTI